MIKQKTCDLGHKNCLYPNQWLADADKFQECHLCGVSLCERCGEKKGTDWFCPDCVPELFALDSKQVLAASR